MANIDPETHRVVVDTPKGPADFVLFGGMAVMADTVTVSCDDDEFGSQRFDPGFDRLTTPVDARFFSVSSYLGAVTRF